MQGKTILIIEDESTLRGLLASNLEKTGFTVFQAESGSKGKELARQTKPDVILLDLILPGEDGVSVLHSLCHDPETKSSKLIVITNLADPDLKSKCLEEGAIEYLVKADYRLDQMVEKIKAVCAECLGKSK